MQDMGRCRNTWKRSSLTSNAINYKETWIYAHSITPIFIWKFLTDNKIKVKRLIFVCGFNEIICYYSDNDPYVKYDAEKESADTISTEQHCIHNGGHLNAESNYIEFKELLNHK